MWAFVAGLLGGRLLRGGRMPDSVKQARWDARQAAKAERRASQRGWRAQWSVRWFRWTVIALALVFVATAIAALVR